MDAGPHMDLLANLSTSVRAQGLHMGIYHSLREWYHPLYIQVHNYIGMSIIIVQSACIIQDNQDKCRTTDFVDEILLPTLMDAVQRYKVYEQCLSFPIILLISQ